MSPGDAFAGPGPQNTCSACMLVCWQCACGAALCQAAFCTVNLNRLVPRRFHTCSCDARSCQGCLCLCPKPQCRLWLALAIVVCCCVLVLLHCVVCVECMTARRQHRQRHLAGRLKPNALLHSPQHLNNAVHVGCAGLAFEAQTSWSLGHILALFLNFVPQICVCMCCTR